MVDAPGLPCFWGAGLTLHEKFDDLLFIHLSDGYVKMCMLLPHVIDRDSLFEKHKKS